MLCHVLEQEQRFVHMPPVLPLILQASSQNAHYLLIALDVIGSFSDFCTGARYTYPVRVVQYNYLCCFNFIDDRRCLQNYINLC